MLRLLSLFILFWILLTSIVYGYTINTLSIVDRINSRIMPELYYALETSAKKNPHQNISFKFTVFNPRKHDYMNLNPKYEENSDKVLDFLENAVPEIMSIKKILKSNKKMVNTFFEYIYNNNKSHLAKAYSYIELIMRDYDFLIIEPTCSSVIHPIFWDKDCKDLISMDANIDDIIDTAYALMFFDVAIKTNKPIIGQCHGAQIGFLYAGGELKKIFDIENEEKLRPAIFGRKNLYGGPDETWNIRCRFLDNRDSTDTSIVKLVKYPVPEYIMRYLDIKRKVYLNKEIQHSLAMVNKPEKINVFTYHPLSSNNIKRFNKFDLKLAQKYPYLTEEAAGNFVKLIIKDIIIDFYKFKTMIGTQYHPQITFNDYDTKTFFDFIIKFIDKNHSRKIKE